MANELKTTKLVLIGGNPIRLPIRAADPVTDLSEGQMYYNSTDKKVRVYDGTTWVDVAGATTAAEVSYDNASSGLAATDAQAAIDEVEARVDTAEAAIIAAQADATQALADAAAAQADVDDLVVLSGVPANSQDLGTFTGTTIPDASTIKAALQSLETAVEAGSDDQTASEVPYSNVTSGLTATDVQAAIDEVEARVDTAETNISSNATAISDHLADTADAHDASAISYNNLTSGLAATDAQAAIDEVEARVDTAESNISTNASNIASNDTDIADLVSLSGVAANSTNLGTFTGATIPDASTVKSALQSLETAVEAAGAQTAADVSYSNITSGLTATDVQAAIDEVEGRLDTAEADVTAAQADATQALADAAAAQVDINDLVTLSGVAANATDLGTFTGAIISDNVSIKVALQELETEFANLPNPITYEGTWAASTNTPTLADGVGDQGDLYQVTDAGSVDFGSGSISFAAGDKVVYNGSTWEKWDMTDAVASVNGQTGSVVLDAADIAYDNASSGLVATTIQAAIDEVESRLDTAESSISSNTSALADKADTDLSNLVSTAINVDLLPDANATRDLGSSSFHYAEAHVNKVATTGQLVIDAANGLARTEQSNPGGSTIEEKYFHGLSLAANTAAFTTISGLSFANATYEGVELEFKIKEVTTNLVRIGKMYVAADGTNVSYSPQYTETGILGNDADSEGLKLQAVLSGGNILIQFKDTKAANACTMNVDVKLFKA